MRSASFRPKRPRRPADGLGDVSVGEEIRGSAVVSGGDAAEVLEAAEHPLDHVAVAAEIRRAVSCRDQSSEGKYYETDKEWHAEVFLERHCDRREGVVTTRTLSESLDNEELVIAVLRDESSAVTFGFKNTAMDWLLSDEFDRSISDAPEESEESASIAAPIAPDELHTSSTSKARHGRIRPVSADPRCSREDGPRRARAFAGCVAAAS
jgi:hypothetical protein